MVVLGFVIDVKLDYSYAVVVAIILGSFANGAFYAELLRMRNKRIAAE
jgi:hypothetical protein